MTEEAPITAATLTPSLWSRRYICAHCGRKGRVSPAKRGSVVRCPVCKTWTPARLLADTLADNAARHGIPLALQPPLSPALHTPRPRTGASVPECDPATAQNVDLSTTPPMTQPIPADSPDPAPPQETRWVGHPMVIEDYSSMPAQRWLSSVQIGLRPDGVVVWRPTPEPQGTSFTGRPAQ